MIWDYVFVLLPSILKIHLSRALFFVDIAAIGETANKLRHISAIEMSIIVHCLRTRIPNRSEMIGPQDKKVSLTRKQMLLGRK